MSFQTLPELFFQSWDNSNAVVHFLYKVSLYVLAIILAFSGITKLIDASGLLSTLQQLAFLNSEFIVLVATLLPPLEIGLAIALYLGWKPLLTLSLTLALFAGFFGISVFGMFLGWTGDCGCFGTAIGSGFGWGMVIRNLILFLAAGFLRVRKSYL